MTAQLIGHPLEPIESPIEFARSLNETQLKPLLFAGYPTAEHRGEGWAFWRVVAPFVSAVDGARATHLTQVYDHQFALEEETADYHYCLALDSVLQALPAGVTGDMLGSLQGAEAVDCGGWEWDEPPSLAELQHNDDVGAMPDCQCSCCKGDQVRTRAAVGWMAWERVTRRSPGWCVVACAALAARRSSW